MNSVHIIAEVWFFALVFSSLWIGGAIAVIVHEGAHWLVARMHGMVVAEVTMMGGYGFSLMVAGARLNIGWFPFMGFTDVRYPEHGTRIMTVTWVSVIGFLINLTFGLWLMEVSTNYFWNYVGQANVFAGIVTALPFRGSDGRLLASLWRLRKAWKRAVFA